MKRRMAGAGAVVMLLVLALMPLSTLMELGAESGKTAEEVYEPLLQIHNQIISEKAQDGVPVGDLIELEDAWAIEDTREESTEPLVTAMLNGSDVLGFDKADNTFYCTLGMETGDEWPEIELKARNVPDGLEIRMVDDYTYDWCSDAIREGYRYEMLAYTDTQYDYFGIVFTGLPIVSVCVEDIDALGDEYIPARAVISSANHEAVDHTAMIHLRGGGFHKKIDKKSYRLEFHGIDSKGKDKKKKIGLLGMEADTDWLLIGNASDATCVRNQMAWDLWNRWNPNGDVHGLLSGELVEVFVNHEYKGLYQLMQRYDVEKELLRMDENPETDYVYRIVGSYRSELKRPLANYMQRASQCFELRHKPDHVSVEEAFEISDDYIKMNEAIPDEEFKMLAESLMDIEAIVSYYLFHQVMNLSTDNVFNNLYVWVTHDQNGNRKIQISPWDMDAAFTTLSWDVAQNEQVYLMMPIPRRILDMNLKNSRETLWRIWNEKRSTILTDDAIYEWFTNMEEYVNQSGASLRNSLRWYGEAQELDMGEMMSVETLHMSTIEHHMLGLWPLEGMVQ